MAKKRSRTREARQRRQRQQRKNQRVLLLALVVAVAIVGAAVMIVSNQPVESFIADDLSARYDGITRSFSIDGYPQLGDLDAPVTVDEYASFACPGCEALHKDAFDAILERAREGQILYTYVPLQTGSIPNAQGAARAALCSGRQGKFWEMHDALYDWQTRYANTAFSQPRLLAGADSLGLNPDSFTSCFNSAAISATLNAAVGEAVSSTPTLNVNGVTITGASGIPTEAEIMQAIDDATPDDWGLPPPVADEAVADESAEVEEEATVEARTEMEDPTPTAETLDEPTPAVTDEAVKEPTDEPTDAAADESEAEATAES